MYENHDSSQTIVIKALQLLQRNTTVAYPSVRNIVTSIGNKHETVTKNYRRAIVNIRLFQHGIPSAHYRGMCQWTLSIDNRYVPLHFCTTLFFLFFHWSLFYRRVSCPERMVEILIIERDTSYACL